MKNNKGFTLIELLAVIVILAVIALIATPVVMNSIEEARKGSARNAAYGTVKAIEHDVALKILAQEEIPAVYDEDSNIDIQGTAPEKMNVPITDGEIDADAEFCVNGFGFQRESSGRMNDHQEACED